MNGFRARNSAQAAAGSQSGDSLSARPACMLEPALFRPHNRIYVPAQGRLLRSRRAALAAGPRRFLGRNARDPTQLAILAGGSTLAFWAAPANAVVMWSDLGATLAHETGAGSDILSGALKRDDSSRDTLYFKFHVDPLSDAGTEEYFAAFQLYEGVDERLGVGNSLKAWGYSAFNTTTNGEFNKVFGDLDLRSSQPESSSPGVFLPYELPRRGIERTIASRCNMFPAETIL